MVGEGVGVERGRRVERERGVEEGMEVGMEVRQCFSKWARYMAHRRVDNTDPLVNAFYNCLYF